MENFFAKIRKQFIEEHVTKPLADLETAKAIDTIAQPSVPISLDNVKLIKNASLENQRAKQKEADLENGLA